MDERSRAATTALVVGASGLVGQSLADLLRRKGFDCRGTYRAHPVAGAVPLDILSRRSVENCFEKVHPEIAFLAVNIPGGVAFCESHPDEADALIVQGTEYAARAAKKHGTLLVYYSTDYLFDGEKGIYSEEDTPKPINVYGRAKYSAETAIRKTLKDFLIVRTTAVFGWNPLSRNFAMQIWERLSRGEEMAVAEDQMCKPTLADFLAEGTLALIKKEARGIFHLVGQDILSRYQMALDLADTMRLDPGKILPRRTSDMDDGVPRPLKSFLKTRKFEHLTGITPLSFEASLERFHKKWESAERGAP